MKALELPHQLADFACPVNGLCDIYEWKTGRRIPDILLFRSTIGFYLISQKNANSPKMVFFGLSPGKRQLNFWKDIIGYSITAGEGKSFNTTLSNVKQLLDRNIPTILFGLDMYHLPYQEKFYHAMHIPGHIVLMVGYDDKQVYIHDNSKLGVQAIPIDDLQLAWANNIPGISKRNAYFGIDLHSPNPDISDILQQCMGYSANFYLNSPLGFMGKRGLEKLIKEFPTWKTIYPDEILKKIYLHFVEYTGSVLPEIPKEIDPNCLCVNDTHRASRDSLAADLIKYQSEFGASSWNSAAEDFQKSGLIIEKISQGFVKDILNHSFSETEKYITLFEKWRDIEGSALSKLLPSRTLDKHKYKIYEQEQVR